MWTGPKVAHSCCFFTIIINCPEISLGVSDLGARLEIPTGSFPPQMRNLLQTNVEKCAQSRLGRIRKKCVVFSPEYSRLFAAVWGKNQTKDQENGDLRSETIVAIRESKMPTIFLGKNLRQKEAASGTRLFRPRSRVARIFARATRRIPRTY